MQHLGILAGFFTSLIISLIAIPSIVKVAIGKGLYGIDRTVSGKERKVPTLGGLAIFAGVMVALNMFSDVYDLPALPHINAIAIGLFFIGLKDDILATAPWWKLMGQILAALIISIPGKLHVSDPGSFIGLPPGGEIIEILLTVIIIVTLMNSYNFIDGIDGLAAGMGIMISLVFGILFWLEGLYFWTLMSASIAGSLTGFARYNLFSRKRKIYMGDTGSLLLGFLLSVMAIRIMSLSNDRGLMIQIQAPLSLVLAVFFIPLFDLLRVILIRITRGRSPFRPDRLHIHYRLVDMGLTHLQSTATLLGINMVIILLVAGFQELGEGILMGVLAAMAIIFSVLIRTAWKRYRSRKN